MDTNVFQFSKWYLGPDTKIIPYWLLSWYLSPSDTVRLPANQNKLSAAQTSKCHSGGFCKGRARFVFPQGVHSPACPPPKTSSCSQSWGQTQALLPQSWFLSFLLEFAEFRYLFSESLPVVSDESSAILESTGRYSLVVEELLLSLILTTGWEIPVREEA